MAQFTIDIPGVGPITVNGNFATEDSINRLSAALNRSNVNDPLSDFRDSVDNSADSLDMFDPSVRRNKRSVDANTKSLNRFNDGFSKIDGMFSDLGDPGSGSLTKLVKSVGDAGAGLVSGISNLFGPLGGIVGGIASGVMGALTGIATTAIGFAQGLVDTNKAIHTAGLGMAGGLEAMQQAAGAANVPFQQFAKAMIDSNESLKLFAGGAPGGIVAVSKAMGRLTRENRDQYQSLLAMGYSLEDIVGTMADLGAQAGLAGQGIEAFGDLAQATDAYLRSQQELNRLTGVDIKQAREKQKANNASLFVQNRLNKIQDPKQRAAAESIMNRVPKSIRDFIISGQSFTKAGGIVQSQMPMISGRLRELYKGVEQGIISQEQVDDELKRIGQDPALKEEIKRVTDVFGSVPGELFKGFDVSDIEDVTMFTRILTGAAEAGASSFDYTKKIAEGMDKAVVSMEQLVTDINSGLSTLGFTLFNFVDGYLGSAGDAVGGVAQKFQNLSQTINDWKTAQERYDAAIASGNRQQQEQALENLNKQNEKINSIFGTASAEGPFEALREKLTGILLDLKTTISEGLQSGFAEVLSSIGYTTEYKAKEEALKATQEFSGPNGNVPLPAVLEQITPEVLSAGKAGVRFKPLTEEEKKLKELYDSLIKLNEESLKQLGYKKELGGLFGQDKLIKIPESELQLNNTQTEQSAKPQALGGIFNYKPGGEKVTVAEAGPEVVLPASRGPDGKIGIEVSGAMLDNSRLLQNLVRVNESQATLIAGLNEKMGNMSNFMEKLVQEQRQANRLAV
jgi:hypothetical protein